MQLEFHYLYIIYRNYNNFLNIMKYLCATTCVTKRLYTIICIFVQHVVNYVYAKPECEFSSIFCRISLSFMVILFFILTNW